MIDLLAHHVVEHNDYWLRIFRTLVISEGGLLLGLAGYLIWSYFRHRVAPLERGPYTGPWHVIMIGTSYILLTIALLLEIVHRAIDGVPVTWRLGVGAVAFTFGIASMIRMSRRMNRRG